MKMQNRFLMGIQASRKNEGKQIRDSKTKYRVHSLMDNALFHHRNLNEKGRENTDFGRNLCEICPVLPLHLFFLFR